MTGTVIYGYDSNPSVAGVCNCQDNSTTGATIETYHDAFGAVESYDPLTCVLTRSNTSQRYVGNNTWSVPLGSCQLGSLVPTAGIPGGYNVTDIVGSYPTGSAVNTSPEQYQLQFTPVNTWGSLFCGPGGTAVTQNLTDVDTDSSAITRLGSPAFGPWVPAVLNSCIAQYQQRTGIQTSFTYGIAQYQLALVGLLPSTFYQLAVDIWEAPHGTTTFALAHTYTYGGTSDAFGNLTITFNISADIGTDAYATNPVLSL